MRAQLPETERLRLRLGDEEDAEAVVRYYTDNRVHLTPWEPRRSEAFFTVPFWREQLQRNQREWLEGRSLRLFLFPREAPREVIGTLNLTEIVRGAFHACLLGYSLAEHAQGKGFMQEALRSVVRYAFEELHLHRIQANYIPHNVRSGRTLRSLGFVVEGYARDYLQINGRWEDHLLTSLTNPSWTPPAIGRTPAGSHPSRTSR